MNVVLTERHNHVAIFVTMEPEETPTQCETESNGGYRDRKRIKIKLIFFVSF